MTLATLLQSGQALHTLGGDSMPGVVVEIAFTSTTDGTPIWTDVTAYVRYPHSNRRGRARETDQFQAGTATFVFDNSDRRFDPDYSSSPYYPNVTPMRPIRIRAQYASTGYGVWSGYVDKWPQSYRPPNDGEVTVTATDAFKVFAQLNVGTSAYTCELLQDLPDSFWRLGDSSGGAMLDSVGSNDGTYQNSPTYGTTAVVPGDTDTAVTFAHSGGGQRGLLPARTLSGFPCTIAACVKGAQARSEFRAILFGQQGLGSSGAATGGGTAITPTWKAGTASSVTASITCTNLNQVLIHVANAFGTLQAVSTITGASISSATVVNATVGNELWKATGTGVAGAVTVTFAGATTASYVNIFELNAAASTLTVLQSAPTKDTSGATNNPSVTLGGLTSGSNVFGSGIFTTAVAATAGTGFTEDNDSASGGAEFYLEHNTAPSSATVNATMASSTGWLWMGVEATNGTGATTAATTQALWIVCYGEGTAAKTADGRVLVIMSDGVATKYAISTAYVDDGSPHHVAVVFASAADWRIYVDGANVTGNPNDYTYQSGYTPTSQSSSVTFPQTDGGWAVGNTTQLNLGDYGFDGAVDEVVLWNKAVTAARIAKHGTAASGGWNGDLTGARITHILDAIGWSSSDRDLAAGTSTLGSAIMSSDALSSLLNVSDAEGGQFFISGAGYVTLRSRYAYFTRALSTTSQATFGDAAGELHFSVDGFGLDMDDTLLRNDVTITRSGGKAVNAKDATSIAAYGTRSYSKSGLLINTDSEARDRAAWNVAHYKSPQLRCPAITIKPQTDPTNLWAQALGREIGDRITVNFRPQSIGLISKQLIIEGISHTIRGGVWETTFTLSPAETQPYWVMDDATYSVLDSTTRAAY